MTGELFQWSYRHLNENANNLIKGLERAERGGGGAKWRKLRREGGQKGTEGGEKDGERRSNRWRNKIKKGRRRERKGRIFRGMSGREEKEGAGE